MKNVGHNSKFRRKKAIGMMEAVPPGWLKHKIK